LCTKEALSGKIYDVLAAGSEKMKMLQGESITTDNKAEHLLSKGFLQTIPKHEVCCGKFCEYACDELDDIVS